jgi:hypothetical protein
VEQAGSVDPGDPALDLGSVIRPYPSRDLTATDDNSARTASQLFDQISSESR